MAIWPYWVLATLMDVALQADQLDMLRTRCNYKDAVFKFLERDR